MVFQNIMMGASGQSTGYNIGQSIRFTMGDSAYLTRTPSSASNRRTWTFSFWWKVNTFASGTSGGYRILQAGSTEFGWSNSDDKLYFIDGSTLRATTQVFRDPTAWQHIVLAVDTTDTTAADRVKIYINGVQVTSFSTSSNPSENFEFDVNATVAQNIGKEGSNYIDAYIAEMYLIDGTQAAPTAFGEFDDSGVWKPIAYSGSFGTNGFYIDGRDSSDLGDDESGNGNDFTSSGLTTADQRSDTPTNNQITFNRLNNQRGGGTVTDGNLVYTGPSTRTLISLTANLPSTGKYAVAFSSDTVSTNNGWNFGITKSNNSNFGDAAGSNEDVGASDGVQMSPSSSDLTLYDYITTGSIDPSLPITTSDEFWLAVDMATGKCFLGIYDASATAMKFVAADAGLDGNPATGDNPTTTITAMIGSNEYVFAAGAKSGNVLTLLNESECSGTTPTGYTYFENVSDFPTPTITDGSSAFLPQLYTGNGSSGLAITNDASAGDFKPDLWWIGPRSNGDNHVFIDVARGQTQRLKSNSSDAEDTDSPAQITFETNGFDLDTTDPNFNGSGRTYVAWQWKTVGGAGSSNESGSINTTTTSVNTTNGLSISTFEGNGTAGQTIGHGLGVKPSWIIIKNRDSTEQWIVYHSELGATKYLLLNGTGGVADSDGAWNDTEPTSTLITLGGGGFGTNVSGNSMVCYAWAEVPGYSSFGSYTGNADANGPFIYTGFRPAFVMVKRTDSTDNWVIVDSARNPFNVANLRLFADTGTADTSSTTHDFTATGFKLRASDGGVNGSGGSFVYMAFAENPFGGEDVAPATAR
jgi:hypothetical protein